MTTDSITSTLVFEPIPAAELDRIMGGPERMRQATG